MIDTIRNSSDTHHQTQINQDHAAAHEWNINNPIDLLSTDESSGDEHVIINNPANHVINLDSTDMEPAGSSSSGDI